MTKTEFIKLMNEDTGIIETTPEGKSICTVCQGTGNRYESSVTHEKDCRFAQAVAIVAGDIPATFILGVENQLTVHTMLTYLTELTNSELDILDRLTTELLRSESPKTRDALIYKIGDWCGTAKPELLRAIITNGLTDDKERVLFRNYLIFEKATSTKLRKLNKDITEALDDREKTESQFFSLFNKKYNLNTQSYIPETAFKL